MAESKSMIIQRVRACFRSENDFERYKPQIIQKIKASDNTYTTCTVDIVKKVLKDKKEDGFTKLFALFLLKEAMDTKNPQVVGYVHKKLLRRLGIMAKGKTKQYFPKDTRDAVVDNFLQLLLECIWIWNEWFGLDSKKQPTKYKTTYDDVASKAKMPKRKVFFLDSDAKDEREQEEEPSMEVTENRPVDKYQESRMQSHQSPQTIGPSARLGTTDNRANKTPVDRSEANTPYSANQPSRFAEESKRDNQAAIENERYKRRESDVKSAMEEPIEEKIYKILEAIDAQKEALLDTMITNTKPSSEVVVMLLTDLKTSNKELKSNVGDLVSRDFPDKELIMDQVLHDSDLITTLISEYQKCHKGQMTMDQYRAFVIKELFTEEDEASQAPSQQVKALQVEPPKVPEKKPVDVSPSNPPSAKPNAEKGFGIDDFESLPAAEANGINPEAFETFGSERSEVKKVPEIKVHAVEQKIPGSRTELNQSFKGSQVSETESRKAPRSFQDLFTSSKPERGRKIEVNKNKTTSRTVDEFANSFNKNNTSKVSGKGNEKPPRQATSQNRAGEIGFEDFDDFQHQTTEQFNDSSVMSQSGQFNFDYEAEKKRNKSPDAPGAVVHAAHNELRGTLGTKGFGSANKDNSSKWSPQSNVLDGYDHDDSVEAHKPNHPNGDQMGNRGPQNMAGGNNQQDNNANYGSNTGYNQQSNAPKPPQQTGIGFDNPFDNQGFGEIDFDAGDFGNEKAHQKAGGIGETGYNTVKKRESESTNANAYNITIKPPSQIPQTPQTPQGKTISPMREPRSSNQGPTPSLLDPTTLRVTSNDPLANMQINNNLSSIERPSNHFMNAGGYSTSLYSEDTNIMRQADQLLDRARRLSGYQIPTQHSTSGYMAGGSVLGGMPDSRGFSVGRPPSGLDRPYAHTFTEPLARDSFRTPAIGTFDPMSTAPRYTTEKVESAVRPATGESFLGEIRQARDYSQAYSGQYDPLAPRPLSAGPSRQLPLPPPTKYLNLGTAAFIQTSDLGRSQYSAASPAKHDTSLVYGSRDKDLKSSYYGGEQHRGTPTLQAHSARTENMSRGYNTGSFPLANDSSDLSKAAQLIEKARRLREQSAKKNAAMKSSTYGTPKTELNYSRHLKESLVDTRDLRQSRFGEHKREHSSSSIAREVGLKQSRIYVDGERESVRREEDRRMLEEERRRLEEEKARFEEEKRRLEHDRHEARRITIEDEIRKDYPGYRGDHGAYESSARTHDRRELSVDIGYLARHGHGHIHHETPTTRDIQPITPTTRDIRPITQKVESALPERVHTRESRHEPRRMLDVNGRAYEEVQRGIGRKPVHSEEPRLLEHNKASRMKQSYVESTGANFTRGRSPGRRYETLGQMSQEQLSFGNTMTTEAAANLRNSAYIRETFNQAPQKNLYQSPMRNTHERHADVVELKPHESTKIVERPVPGSANKARTNSRGPAAKSPAMREVITEPDYTTKATAIRGPHSPVRTRPPIPVYSQVHTHPSSPKPVKTQSQQLANEIKDQIEALKRSLVVNRRPSDTQETAAHRIQEHVTRESREARAYQQSRAANNTNNDMRKSRVERPGVRVAIQDQEINRKGGNIGVDAYPSRDEAQTPRSRRDLKGYEETRNDAFRMIQELKRSKAEPMKVSRVIYEDQRVPVREVREAVYEEEIAQPAGRRLSVKEISGVPGVKLTVDNSDIWDESSDRLTRARTMEDSMRDYRGGFEPKEKWGRAINFDYYLFDQITNAIYANSQGKDVDAFKAACLLNKAVIFEHPLLKVDVITRIESVQGEGDYTLKLIMHYGNKANQSLTGFSVDILDKVIDRNPQVAGAALTPKYQLKQDLFVNFFDYKSQCYTMQISFQHEGDAHNVNIPLPLTINKFMKMKSVESTEYKKRWKTLKHNAVKSKYRHINAKFLRSHTEINKYFDNALFDITPIVNPKRKRKYGGMFSLPDKGNYYVRITLDSSRAKFVVSSDSGNPQYCDWAVQYLSFLLTV